MISYADYPSASISMSSKEDFVNALNSLFNEYNIEYIFESGTFNGLGSTTKLANAIIKNNRQVKQFITVEVSKKFFRQAQQNLAQFSFITPVWGLTVNGEEAKEFIKQDDAINNHEKYPDIFIDDTTNPRKFYLDEIDGQLAQSLTEKIKSVFQRNNDVLQEDLFKQYLPDMASKKPLILLDSAGGVGYFEFQQVMKYMAGNDFFLVLDDVHHLKHFRSYRDVKADSHFTILNENYAQGWVLAKYKS